MPESRAVCCASLTCSVAIHCSQRLNSNRSRCSAMSCCTASLETVVSLNQGLSPHGAPHTSKHRLQAAKESRSGPAFFLKSLELRFAFRGAPGVEDDTQCRSLGIPCGIDVHRAGILVVGGHAIMQRIDLRSCLRVEIGVFGDVLRTNVGDVEEASGLRQVWRRLQRGESGAQA